MPIHTRYAAPASLMASNASGDERSNAATPSAASVVWNVMPVAKPSAATRPAARPCEMPRASTCRLSGPGAIVIAIDVARNKAKLGIVLTYLSLCGQQGAHSGVAPRSMTFETRHGIKRQTAAREQLRAAKLGQVDNRRAFNDHCAEPLEQNLAGHHRAAGRDQIVDDQHAVARLARVLVNFHGGRAVFELVRLRRALVGQFALLTDRNEAEVQLIGENRPDDETTR